MESLPRGRLLSALRQTIIRLEADEAFFRPSSSPLRMLIQVQMKSNIGIFKSSSIVNLMIYSDLSRNMEELFKLNEKYSVMYLTIVCDDTKLLNINEIHFYLFVVFCNI